MICSCRQEALCILGEKVNNHDDNNSVMGTNVDSVRKAYLEFLGLH
jgi:hypothetical protein